MKIDLSEFYHDNFYSRRRKTPRGYQIEITEILIKKFSPTLVYDFGCGVGTFLIPFRDAGIKVFGIESTVYATKYLSEIPAIIYDLRDPLKLKKRCDLGLSIAVAEHIDEEFADQYIENVAENTEKVIYFSTTDKPNPKKGHITLKPYGWWIEKFRNFGFNINGDLSSMVQLTSNDIPEHYKTAIILVRK